ncbi:MAG: serine--tRNA ligase [Victivallaceae bacterium]
MLDIKLIRKNPEQCEKLLKRKVSDVSLSEILTLDERIRNLKTESERLVSHKKTLSEKIRLAKSDPNLKIQLIQEVDDLKEKIAFLEQQLTQTKDEFFRRMSYLPNYPEETVPVAEGKEGNIVIKSWSEKPTFNFHPLNHLELNDKHVLFDFERTAKTTGSGWPAYRNLGAKLEWALLSFMMDKQVEHGFELWLPPLLVKKDILFGSGQIPKFDGQYYKVEDGNQSLYLIPTAEVVLNGLHSNEIFRESELPLTYAAFSPCFRREAGAAGAQERGLVRVHQFHKIEMFAFTTPEQNQIIFDKMLATAEDILISLGLHYQLSLLSTGDMSFTACRTIDVEVWLPGQSRYYEVSSISNCSDYQARRSNIRYKDQDNRLHFAHTLNGSGLATPRLMVALLENNQTVDGSIIIPQVLRKYLNGMERIEIL